MRIKNWEKYQHYKDRDPPWVKLHRSLLNDPDWFDLDPVAAKAMVMLWLIASENEGNLPDARKLAFRLRITEIKMRSILQQLSHWLVHDASTPLATCPPETEAETQEKTEADIPSSASAADDFPEDFRERFWEAYPRKVGKAGAIGRLERLRKQHLVSWAKLIAAVRAYAATADPQFTKHPITWLNQGCWDDEPLRNGTSPPPVSTGPPQPPSPDLPSDEELRKRYANTGRQNSTAGASISRPSDGLDCKKQDGMRDDQVGDGGIRSVGPLLRMARL